MRGVSASLVAIGQTRFARIHLAAGIMATVASCASAGTPVQEATLLASAGEGRRAIELLRSHLATHPDSLAERRLLVRLYGAVGDVSLAEREAKRLAKLVGPNDPTPWLEMGHVFELAHRFDDALAMYDRAALAAPGDATGPRVGGLRAARWGELDLALPRLEEAVKRDPTSAEAWHALGLVKLHSGDPAGARRAYLAGLRADPDAVENRLGLATAALELGEAREALAQYDRILLRRPGNVGALLGRSWTLILLGRYAEARRALAEVRQRGGEKTVVEAQLRVLAGLEERRLTDDNH
jgi:tetratricopeptide (TPR) repeat protein